MVKKQTRKPQSFCWMNGRIIPVQKAAIPVTDIAVLRGYAVFDSMLAVGNAVLHVQDHLDRFFNSARIASIPLRYSKKDLESAFSAVLKKNGNPLSKVRIIATGGEMVNGLEFKKGSGSVIILVDAYEESPKRHYEQGIRLMSVEYQRPLPHAKTTNYALAVNLQKERAARGAFEILYTSGGNVYECSTSNFFLVKGKQLLTADTGILPGIIRQFIIDSASAIGLKAIQRPITWKDVRAADEAFITGTYKGVIPVVRIDDIIVGNGKVGHAASAFQELYHAFSIEA